MSGRRLWTFPARLEPESILWDRAFRYGMSVFETVAVSGGRPLFIEEHLGRLRSAATDLLGCSADGIISWARDLLLNRLADATGVARIYCTGGPGGLTTPADSPAGVVLYEPAEVGCRSPRPVSAALDRAPVVAAPGGWKTGNYWQNIRALAAARAEGFDEAIICDPAGRVVGSATGNLFAMIRGRLLTPAIETGARPGVVREWVMAGTGAGEDLISPADLACADEVFLTNSRVGILPVGRIDGSALASIHFAGALAGRYFDEVLEHR